MVNAAIKKQQQNPHNIHLSPCSESEDVYKILIIGDSGVGKTCLVQQLTVSETMKQVWE